MKPSIVLPVAFALFALGTGAQAATGLCIDTSRSYEAHAVAPHDVILRSTMGKPRTPLLLSTSCIALDKADRIAVSTQFNCVSLGDTVVATKVDGHRQACRVTRVVPYVPPETQAKP